MDIALFLDTQGSIKKFTLFGVHLCSFYGVSVRMVNAMIEDICLPM